MNLIIRILANLGLVLGLYLATASGGDQVLGCGAGSGCDAVLGSVWSRWLGVPVGWFAVVVYALVVGLSWRMHGLRSRGWSVLVVLGMLLIGAGLWFVGVQIFILGALCPWCMAEHGIGLVVGVLLLRQARVARGYGDGRAMLRLGGIAGGLLAVLVVGQMLGWAGWNVMGRGEVELVRVSGEGDESDQVGENEGAKPHPPTPHTAAEKVNRAGENVGRGVGGNVGGVGGEVRLLGGRVRLRPSELPMMGSAEAAHILVVLLDYNCPHCRLLHEHLRLAIERYGEDQIGVVVLPVPLEAECNPEMAGFAPEPRFEYSCEIATLAMGVYRRDPVAYAALDEWMFLSEKDRREGKAGENGEEDGGDVGGGGSVGGERLVISEVYEKAVALLGVVEVEAAIRDEWAKQRIAMNVKLYELLDGGTIPKLLFGDVLLPGRRGNAEVLFADLEAELGVEARAGK